MATTWARYGNTSESVTSYKSKLGVNPTGRVNIVISGQFETDVAADDFTIYDVPTGRTFVLTSFSGGYNTDGSYQLGLYDDHNDTVLSTQPKFVGSFSYWARTLNPINFTQGIIFEKGISLKGSEMPNSKAFNCVLQGYLI